jgi:heme a synthase
MTLAEKRIAAQPKIRAWLWIVALLVVAMVLVGGATRLTDSGLSITEWQPFAGAIPPLNAADWEAAFAKYKLTPEFLTQNAAMTLEEFKTIFWWEWGHRFLGRFIGIAFAVPFLAFLALRRIDLKLFWRLLAIFALGAAQGGMGWYMVQSGLVDRVDVSQYRLAAHLTLATVIFAALCWTALGVGEARRRPRYWNDWIAVLLLALILLQIAAGGFVAGIDAGMGYNTWPKMDGEYIPDGLLAMQPAWKNLFENAMTVQFDHRMLAYAILLVAMLHAWQSCTLASLAILYILFVQAMIGIMAVVLQVPFALALTHQAGAMLAVAAAVWNLHRQVRDMPGKLPSPASLIPA